MVGERGQEVEPERLFHVSTARTFSESAMTIVA
jgi:hypothetical protein